MSMASVDRVTIPAASKSSRTPRRTASGASLPAQGHPMVWLTAGMLGIALAMVIGLLLLVFVSGVSTFWPVPIVRFELVGGATHMGEVTRRESYEPAEDVVARLPVEALERAGRLLDSQGGVSHRELVRTGNYDLTNEHFNWVSDFEIADKTRPEWAVIFERLTWGRFYGEPVAFFLDGDQIANDPAGAWAQFKQYHRAVSQSRDRRYRLESRDIGHVNHLIEKARLDVRTQELRVEKAEQQYGAGSEEYRRALESLQEEREYAATIDAEAQLEYSRVRTEIDAVNAENARYQILMRISDGREVLVPLAEVVRGYPANRLSFFRKIGVYVSRWFEFFTANPREANSEGGVFPAIFGTIVMTLIMSVLVVPFGVIAALYLREYAKAGPLVSTVRIAINNLAGVPSIVFGVFGLGFFSYFLGGAIDQAFFAAKLPSPTYGTGGILWASLTLALLTLPVVIVATEEALSAVPSSMREGSYSCGASKWQTIKRIVLPKALPGIMTGMILAMARGAGEVAPLMLVGAVKLAPELPIDRYFPFIHLERSFMHLGFHIYDVGFQSQNSEAAKPMVFTTTILLIGIIVVLNLVAIRLRNRLNRRFVSSQF
ncbi:MAG: phosphate ABC transporter permease PstA [Spirochaetales bacterium]|nr:phosphate ABC transporter permease PstA [Spirochaetales bacterium]